MKTTILIVCLLLLVVSCSTNRYLLTGKGDDQYFLQQRIDESVKKGMISNTPLLVIDGRPYQYDVKLKTQKLNLSRRDITQIDILKTEPAVSIYGEMGKKGVVLITTSASMQDKGNTNDKVLVLLEGNKKSIVDMKKIDPMDIESVNVIKKKSEIQKYTIEPYESVIVFKLKKRIM